MSKLKTYSEFVNEGLIDAIKNPIKFTKIKNNAKKFQKAKVAQALNDVDYAKRKEKGADTLSTKQKEVLTQANKAKNAALKDTTSQIGSRMDDLATTPGLKQVVKVAKTKTSLAANGIVLKAATGEEAKQLKIKQKELTKKAAAAQQGLGEYESTDKKEEPVKKAAPPKVDDTKVDDTKVDDKPKVDDTKVDDTKVDDTKVDDKPKVDDPTAKLEADIKAYNKSIEVERASMTKSMKELEQAKRDQKLGRVSDEQVQTIMKRIEDSKEDIAELKKKEGDAKKKLSVKVPESFEYVAESVSEKFARLRSNL